MTNTEILDLVMTILYDNNVDLKTVSNVTCELSKKLIESETK